MSCKIKEILNSNKNTLVFNLMIYSVFFRLTAENFQQLQEIRDIHKHHQSEIERIRTASTTGFSRSLERDTHHLTFDPHRRPIYDPFTTTTHTINMPRSMHHHHQSSIPPPPPDEFMLSRRHVEVQRSPLCKL